MQFFHRLEVEETITRHKEPRRLTSPGAGEGGGGGGSCLPVGEGGEVADALAALDGPIPDLYRGVSED